MVVVGLSQTGDTSALRAALTAAGLSPDDVQSVGPDDAAENLAREAAPSGIITSDRGMSVPGITGGENRTFFYDESLVDRLGDFGIPESEFDNYLGAVERGKTVIAYFAEPDSVDKVTAVFSAANVSNVRQY